MFNIEEALSVSKERVDDCREELDLNFLELITSGEDMGYTRKEILVALSELTAEELTSLPDLPRLH